jgi:hypothetical protein
MRKSLLAMLVVVASVGVTAGLSPAGSAPVPMALSVDMMGTAPDQAPPAQAPFAGEPWFMAAQEDTWACIEDCSLKHQKQCEKDNKDKNKPGTKENWDESKKCWDQYWKCKEKC